jgi:hypothetical protein
MNNAISRSAVWGLIAAIALISLPALSRAQSEKESATAKIMAKQVSLEMENADLRYALKLLFKSAGANYTIDPAVQGTVTASLTDVPFRKALESVLKTASSALPLTYRVEEDVFHVSVRKEAETAGPNETPEIEKPSVRRPRIVKIHLNFMDPADLADLLGGNVIRTRYGSDLLVGFGNGNGATMGGGQGVGSGNFGNGNGGFGNNGSGSSFGNNGSGFNGSNGNFGFGNQGNGNFGRGTPGGSGRRR